MTENLKRRRIKVEGMEKETESNGTPVLSLWEGKTDMEKLSPISWEGIKEKTAMQLKD